MQESNLALLHCRQILYRLSYEGSSHSLDLCPDWGLRSLIKQHPPKVLPNLIPAPRPDPAKSLGVVRAPNGGSREINCWGHAGSGEAPGEGMSTPWKEGRGWFLCLPRGEGGKAPSWWLYQVPGALGLPAPLAWIGRAAIQALPGLRGKEAGPTGSCQPRLRPFTY